MKIAGLEKEFIIVGENVHTTRIVRLKGKRVVDNSDGVQSVRYFDADKNPLYLEIPEKIKSTQDYEEGRVKHVKIAVQTAMSGEGAAQSRGLHYLHHLIRRQVNNGADFLDLNVDEVSLRLDDQKTAIQWLVRMAQEVSPIPLSIDSSNIEIIQAGLEACDNRAGRPLLNSASLERIEALDLAVQHETRAIVTAAGESGMPQNAEERLTNASRMVDAALAKGLAPANLYIDPLVFPISVDKDFGNHCFEAIRQLREKYGPEIHISGGFSNVSFGLPCRRIINDAFFILAIEAGADSGIIDPVTSNPKDVFAIDQESTPYKLAEAMLLGEDRNCKAFLRAYRNGDLTTTG
jgi:hypothetical protein